MPWCPKCKTEYRAGFTRCVDCDTDLVDELPESDDYEEVVALKDDSSAKKFVDFLAYSNITSYYEYSDENQAYSVYCHEKDIKKAKKCFQAFYTVELDKDKEADSKAISEDVSTYEYGEDSIDSEYAENTNELEAEDDDLVFTSSSVYVKKSDQYKDLRSTAVTFLAFGFGGLIFLVLNILGVISFIHGAFAFSIMGLMFAGFIYIGLNSITRSKKAAKEAILEEELTSKINGWLETNITEEVIDNMQDSTISREANYFKLTNHIKKLLINEFGEMDDSYLDAVIEDYYNQHFEN